MLISSSAPFRRIAALFRENRHLQFGAPLLVFVVGLPFFLKDVFQVRYDYRGQSSAHMDEAEKYGQKRLAQAEAKRIAEGGDPNEVPEYKLRTIEEEHEIYMKEQYSDTYEMVSKRMVEEEPSIF